MATPHMIFAILSQGKHVDYMPSKRLQETPLQAAHEQGQQAN